MDNQTVVLVSTKKPQIACIQKNRTTTLCVLTGIHVISTDWALLVDKLLSVQPVQTPQNRKLSAALGHARARTHTVANTDPKAEPYGQKKRSETALASQPSIYTGHYRRPMSISQLAADAARHLSRSPHSVPCSIQMMPTVMSYNTRRRIPHGTNP